MPQFRNAQYRVRRSGARAPLPLSARSVGHYRWTHAYRESPAVKPFLQVFWGKEGTVFFGGEGEERTAMGPGEVFIYPPGSCHEVTLPEDDTEYYWWTMDGPLAENISEAFGIAPPWPRYAGDVPAELFERLFGELRDVSIAGEWRAGATAYELLSLLGRRLHAGADEPDADPLAEACAKAFLDRYADSSLGVEQVARELGVHRSVLARRFRKALGVPPVRYLQSVRVQRALSLLKETSLPVGEIARSVGFPDPNYFSRLVKRSVGQSPRSFRHG
jgi:AraC-like DNA-binding protein